jgi:hypothetical protein
VLDLPICQIVTLKNLSPLALVDYCVVLYNLLFFVTLEVVGSKRLAFSDDNNKIFYFILQLQLFRGYFKL